MTNQIQANTNNKEKGGASFALPLSLERKLESKIVTELKKHPVQTEIPCKQTTPDPAVIASNFLKGIKGSNDIMDILKSFPTYNDQRDDDLSEKIIEFFLDSVIIKRKKTELTIVDNSLVFTQNLTIGMKIWLY